MATALTVRLLLTRFYINRLTTKNTVLYFQLKIQTKDLCQSLDRLRAALSFRRSPSVTLSVKRLFQRDALTSYLYRKSLFDPHKRLRRREITRSLSARVTKTKIVAATCVWLFCRTWKKFSDLVHLFILNRILLSTVFFLLPTIRCKKKTLSQTNTSFNWFIRAQFLWVS